jgi:Mitochondrial biogenesis AIM24
LQKLEGKGDVLLQAGGALVRKDLNEGESLRISSGCLVAFTSTVDYDVAMMPGFANVVFGGEGLFVTTLKGPGTVWLQGMPPDRMIGEIARRVPPGIGLGIPIPMGIGGGSGDATPVSEDTPAEGNVPLNDTETEGMEAANDVLVAGDRQSTVASSGLSADQPVDFESPNALFGDAGPSGDLSAPSSQDGSFRHASNERDSISFEQSKMDNVNDDFVEQSTFSTNDEFSADFEDDDTTFSTFEGSNTGDNLDIGDVEGVQASGNSVLNTLWNMFTGGDD